MEPRRNSEVDEGLEHVLECRTQFRYHEICYASVPGAHLSIAGICYPYGSVAPFPGCGCETCCVSVGDARLGLPATYCSCWIVAPFRGWSCETRCVSLRCAAFRGGHVYVDGVTLVHWRGGA